MPLVQRKNKKVTRQDLEEEFDLGELRGTFPASGPLIGATLVLLRLITAFCIVLIIAVFATHRPGAGYLRALIPGGVVLVLYGIRFGWQWTSARFGIRRHYLYAQGLVTTGWGNGVRGWILWSEVTGVTRRRMSIYGLFIFIQVVRIKRADLSTFQLVLLGINPPLLQQMRKLTG